MSLSSTAIDGARISCFLAMNLVAMDPDIGDFRRAEMLETMELAGAALDKARQLFPVIITSLHVAGGR